MTNRIQYFLVIVILTISSNTTSGQSNADSIYYELFRSELYGDGDLLKAKGFALMAYKESLKLNHPGIQAKSSRALGMIYWRLSNFDSSSFYLYSSLNVSKVTGFYEYLTASSNDLGNYYQKLDYYDSALKYYQVSLESAQALDLHEDEAFALNNIGLVYYYLEDFGESLRYFERALEVKKRHALGSLGISLKNIALVYNDQGRYQEALVLLNQVEDNYKNDFDDDILADLYDDIAYANYHIKHYRISREYYELAYDIAIKSGNKSAEANALHHFALLDLKDGKYEDAWDNLSASLRLAEQQKSRRLKRELYLAFRELYIAQGKLEEAMLYHHKYNELKDSIFNGKVVGNLSKIRLDAQKKDMDSIIQDKESKIQTFQTTTILTAVIAVLLVVVSLLLFFGFRSRGRINKILDAKVKERTRELVVQNQELNLKTTVQQNINTRLEGKVKALTATLNGLKHVIKKDGENEVQQTDSDKARKG